MRFSLRRKYHEQKFGLEAGGKFDELFPTLRPAQAALLSKWLRTVPAVERDEAIAAFIEHVHLLDIPEHVAALLIKLSTLEGRKKLAEANIPLADSEEERERLRDEVINAASEIGQVLDEINAQERLTEARYQESQDKWRGMIAKYGDPFPALPAFQVAALPKAPVRRATEYEIDGWIRKLGPEAGPLFAELVVTIGDTEYVRALAQLLKKLPDEDRVGAIWCVTAGPLDQDPELLVAGSEIARLESALTEMRRRTADAEEPDRELLAAKMPEIEQVLAEAEIAFKEDVRRKEELLNKFVPVSMSSSRR